MFSANEHALALEGLRFWRQMRHMTTLNSRHTGLQINLGEEKKNFT